MLDLGMVRIEAYELVIALMHFPLHMFLEHKRMRQP